MQNNKNQNDPAVYLNYLKSKANTITNKLNINILPINIYKSIEDAKKKILYMIEAEEHHWSKSAYEASQNWLLNKKYLDSLYKELADKVYAAAENIKSVQNTH